jgi:methyltransferase-like protein
VNKTIASYDKVPYPSQPFPSAHLERLFTMGKIFGLDPAPIGDCRVLELGCSDGGNILPMAMAFPESRFTGLDLSRHQVKMGNTHIEALKVHNLSLIHSGIEDLSPEAGTFDYIICHGVYSWVPPEIQDKIMAAIDKHLAPQGVAYVSYNTYPGWAAPATLRELMKFHTHGIENPNECIGQALAIADFMASFIQTENDEHAGFLKKEIEKLKNIRLNTSTAAYIYHEYLEDVNTPVYFHEFAKQVAKNGLQYLGESVYSEMSTHGFPQEVNDALGQIDNIVQIEQYMDFLRNRRFRKSLLCRAERTLTRKFPYEQIADYNVVCTKNMNKELIKIAPGAPVSKAALDVLLEERPKALSFEEVLSRANQRIANSEKKKQIETSLNSLVNDLLHYFSLNMIQLCSWQPEFTLHPGSRPKVLNLARYQAEKEQQWVTNAFHEAVILPRPLKLLGGLADGKLDRNELAFAMKNKLIESGVQMMGRQDQEPVSISDLNPTALAGIVDQMLTELAAKYLLEE